MAGKLNHLMALFTQQIKDAYSAETQLLAALPKMRDAASNESLREAFASHLEQTQEHAARLGEISEQLGFSPKGHRCKAMAGLIEEGKEVIDEEGAEPSVKDAALICAAQKVEHYEMALYGCLSSYAGLLSLDFAQTRLESTLAEERHADSTLTQLADQSINLAATEAGG